MRGALCQPASASPGPQLLFKQKPCVLHTTRSPSDANSAKSAQTVARHVSRDAAHETGRETDRYHTR